MALSDALLELAVRWDDDLSHAFDGEACWRLRNQLSHAVELDDPGPLADAIATAISVVGQRDPLVDALDRPRFRSDDVGAALPARTLAPTGEPTWTRHIQGSDETFLALVLRDRLGEHDGPRAVRVAARRNTLASLTHPSQPDGPAFLRAVAPGTASAAPLLRAEHLQQLVAFDPAEAFLELPPHLRTWKVVAQLRLSVRLVPDFQFLAEQESPIAAETNTILCAGRDPWGAASWWVTLNSWLDARPVDLLGTPRAAEIAPAAHQLTSGAW
jgi:hypothetical protein